MKTSHSQSARLNRRRALEVLGAFGAGVAALRCGGTNDGAARVAALADAAPDGLAAAGLDASGAAMTVDGLSCLLTPALSEGPFFVDENLERSDLTANETDPGVVDGYPLGLSFGVYAVTGQACRPMTGAHVDIWHADVNGLYSDIASGVVQSTDTTGKKFLRAYQVVGDDGLVSFKTIYPGWYLTRTVHVHVKVRLYDATGNKTFEATTQMFFDDAITDSVFAQGAYALRGARSVPKNTEDQIFNGTGVGSAIDTVGPPAGRARPGDSAMATLSKLSADGAPGYLAAMIIGVQMS